MAAESTCQAGFAEFYRESDCAHTVENLFQPGVQELMDFYKARGIAFVGIQFHGHADTSCLGVSVYLTSGMDQPPVPGDQLLDLQSSLKAHNPSWVVTVPGNDPPCNLHGSRNVQGRLLNHVPPGSVCSMDAANPTGRFIHVEQKPGVRAAADWIPAVNDTCP